jgi:hypothetical protein
VQSLQFSIGGGQQDRIEVTVLGYERLASGNSDDDNWLSVQVAVSVGAFSGRYQASFITVELIRFKSELETLYRTLKGVAQFSAMEEQLALTMTSTGLGQIQLEGAAQDVSGTGNRLEFAFDLDQSYLAQTLAQLDAVVLAFPQR